MHIFRSFFFLNGVHKNAAEAKLSGNIYFKIVTSIELAYTIHFAAGILSCNRAIKLLEIF